MKLKEYIQHLNNIAIRYGTELDVVYCIDDEGNTFMPVHYHPAPGVLGSGGNFYVVKDDETSPEVVCIN